MNKKLFFISIFSVILISMGCQTTSTSTNGKANEMYIQFAGKISYGLENSEAQYLYNNGIDVVIDDNLKFHADVNDITSRQSNYKFTYSLKPGKHTVSAYLKGKEILTKVLFASAQETKIVELP